MNLILQNEQTLDKQKWSQGQREITGGDQGLSSRGKCARYSRGKEGVFRAREKFSVPKGESTCAGGKMEEKIGLSPDSEWSYLLNSEL